MPAIKPLDPLGIESESDPLGIESQSDPLGIEQPSLARDILTANQSALELAGQANQMVNTGLAARDIMLDRPELEGPGFNNPEDIRKVPTRDTVLGDRGTPVPFSNYELPPEERQAQFVEGLTTPPVSIPRFGIGPTWLEKVLAVANPVTLPQALATSPTKAAQTQRSIANAAIGLGEFGLTPAGILTTPLAAGVLGKTVATLTKLGFSADMAKAAGEQAGSLVGEWDNLSELERTDKLVGLGFTTFLATSLAKHTAPEAARAIADRVERGLVGQKKSGNSVAAKAEAGADTIPSAKSGETLDDVYQIFEPKKEPSQFNIAGLKRGVTKVAESLSTGLSSKFRPLNKLAEDIAKAYGRATNKNIAAIFEQLKGSQGKGEADVYRFDRDVSSLVKGSEKDFNAYMFLRRSLDRLQQDAKDITGELARPTDNFKANRRQVAGYTIRSLTSKLATLEAKLGNDKLAKFQEAAQKYQDWMDSALKLQVESGRMSPEVYKAIKQGNQFYAPFKVMKYLEETQRPEGTGRKIDTVAEFTKAMTGIEDVNFRLGDMLGAARQSILISRILAEKNKAMQNITEQALLDPEHRFVQKVPNPTEAPLDKRVVTVLENGKTTYYAVEPSVAEAIQLFGENGGGVISKVLRASSVPFKAGATALNVQFQVSNLMADVPRQALVSKYGVTSPVDLVRYPLDIAHALLTSIQGDVVGHQNPALMFFAKTIPGVEKLRKANESLFLDFLDSGTAGATVQEHLTPNALKFQEPTAISRSKRLASSVLNLVPEFAAAIEHTSKIVGVKRAMRFEGVTSGKELAAKIPEAVSEIRRFSGSPDFGRQGKWVEQARLNLLYMFLNARIQGSIADIGRLGGRDGAKVAATTWFRVGTAVGLPTAYLYYLNQLPEYKDDYDKRPQQEKDNYWLIPKDSYITTEDGEKIRDYWRIPKRESAKWIGNMTESALKFAQNRSSDAFYNFGQKMLEDISPVNVQGNTAQERAESVAASLNPVLKAPLEFATGRDLYRHRQLVPDTMKAASPEQQYTDRTPEAFKKLAEVMPDVAPEILRSPIMLENLTRNLTAGLLTQFLPRKPVEGRSKLENNPLLARFQAMPYSDQESFKLEMQKLERSAADEFLARHRKANELLQQNKGKDIREIAAKAGQDPKLIRHLVDLYVAKENGATQQDRQVMALPVKQRAEYVAGLLKNLDAAERAAKVRDLARKRILTEAVAEELTPELFK